MKSRFSSRRTTRIVGWTTAALAWSVAIGGRAFGYFGAPEPVVADPQPVEQTTSSAVAASSPVPNMPERGLVIVRIIAPGPDDATAERSESSQGDSATPTTAAPSQTTVTTKAPSNQTTATTAAPAATTTATTAAPTTTAPTTTATTAPAPAPAPPPESGGS